MTKDEHNQNSQVEEQPKEEATITDADIVIKLLKERISIDRLTTHIINLKDIKIPNALNILKLNGAGKVTEVAVIAPSTTIFSMFIKVDGKELLNKNADYTTLAELSGILNDVDADTSGANSRVVIRNINFTKSILIQVNSESEITAENIFCKYDLQNQPPEETKGKVCDTGR